MPEISAGREKKPAMRAFFVFVFRDWARNKQEPTKAEAHQRFCKTREQKNRNPAIAVQKESGNHSGVVIRLVPLHEFLHAILNGCLRFKANQIIQ